ncbi:MAG: glycosyltransferase [Caldilineaceae bacterium]|nr:glycosyltransferase [Caldilineaceae bacterium]
MRRILILMSDTGGGHRASAEALQSAFATRFPGRFQVEIVDLWTDYTPWPINRLPRLYSPLVARALWLWKLLWLIFENERALSAVLRLVYPLCRKEMARALQMHRPHLIISVHPLMQQLFLWLIEKEGPPTPFVTVVTDLASFHHGWFHTRAQRCFVASETAANAARRHGLQLHQIRLLGLPVRSAFAQTLPDRATARASLGLTGAAFTALLVGGGEGMGPVAAIAHAVAHRLAATGTEVQLIVICGRNRRLRRALQRAEWPLPVQVHGYVDNMQAWMTAADCIITKAGPGTIAEALICGLPILLSGFIPGQEEGNVPFVVENRVGAYCESPRAIAETVGEWASGDELERIAARARRLGRPRAAYDIVDEIVGLMEGEGGPGGAPEQCSEV